ncbi:hypothetical protein KFL_004730070 [Klebsormidium nitens]|uniref:Uncharacterized protein n=1 Tax=Klebsormidium nitens TaxID=105231 RepID=A0A1Y1IHJ2_KLENI|nr:hypothetical protein KFL_004730070 [Klebsormidium nitens]|eukprot:GAQ88959.1 hypothetical protein KFL_004730070 [Klebsormidium nitens]
MIVFIRFLGVIAGGLCSALLLRACFVEENEKAPGETGEEPGEKESEKLALVGGGDLEPGEDDRAVTDSVGGNASGSEADASEERKAGNESYSNREDLGSGSEADVISQDSKVGTKPESPRKELGSEEEDSDCETGPCEESIAQTTLAPPERGGSSQGARECEPGTSPRADAKPQNGGVKRNSEILRELGRKIGSGDFTGDADLSAVLNTGKQMHPAASAPVSVPSSGTARQNAHATEKRTAQKQSTWFGGFFPSSVKAPPKCSAKSGELGSGSIYTGPEEDWETVGYRNVPAEGCGAPAEHMLASMIVIGEEEKSALSDVGTESVHTGAKSGATEAERCGSEIWASMIFVDPPETEASPEKGDQTCREIMKTSPPTEVVARSETGQGRSVRENFNAEERAKGSYQELEGALRKAAIEEDLPVSESPSEDGSADF